jgi:hypothetical protein
MGFKAVPANPKSSAVLPPEVRSLLWDCDPAAVSWPSNQDFLSRRVLAHGGWDALKWIRARAGDEELAALLLSSQGRGIDPRRLRYFELIFRLPKSRVNRWLREREKDPWTNRLKARAGG